MSITIDLVASLWGHVGPGLLLVAAFPFMLVALGFVLRTGVQRARVSR